MRYRYVGIDEVGRGAWAGPLVLAAVCYYTRITFPEGLYIRDSKALNRAQRRDSAAFLRKNSTFCIKIVSRETVDKYGVHKATIQGIIDVSHKIKEKIMRQYQMSEEEYSRRYYHLVDGRPVCKLDQRHEFIIGGDDKVPVISAASIVAKVFRDRYMERMGRKYPEYGFERHVGYGTQAHQEAIRTHGISPIHRLSYKPIKLYTEGVNRV